MPLTSALFKANKQLQDCAILDTAHIVADEPPLRRGENNQGEHVALIHKALRQVMPSPIFGLEEATETYGPKTAEVVRQFKAAQNPPLLNKALGQTVPDNIVGKLTIAALDREVSRKKQPPGGGSGGPANTQAKRFVFAPFNGPFRIKFGPDDRAKSDLSDQPTNSGAARFAKSQFRIGIDPSKDQCEAALLSTIGNGGSDARELATFFFNNRSRAILRSFADGTFWPTQVKKDPVFTANHADLSAKIQESLQELANRNRTANRAGVDVNLLREGGTQPQPLAGQITKIDFSAIGLNTRILGNPLAFGFGSIQGVDIRITSFSGDNKTGAYQGLLIYRIVDHFGADDSFKDVAGQGQAGLFLLQRGMATGQDKSRYKPYVSEIIAANVAFTGQLT